MKNPIGLLEIMYLEDGEKSDDYCLVERCGDTNAKLSKVGLFLKKSNTSKVKEYIDSELPATWSATCHNMMKTDIVSTLEFCRKAYNKNSGAFTTLLLEQYNNSEQKVLDLLAKPVKQADEIEDTGNLLDDYGEQMSSFEDVDDLDDIEIEEDTSNDIVEEDVSDLLEDLDDIVEEDNVSINVGEVETKKSEKKKEVKEIKENPEPEMIESMESIEEKEEPDYLEELFVKEPEQEPIASLDGLKELINPLTEEIRNLTHKIDRQQEDLITLKSNQSRQYSLMQDIGVRLGLTIRESDEVLTHKKVLSCVQDLDNLSSASIKEIFLSSLVNMQTQDELRVATEILRAVYIYIKDKNIER